MFHSGDFAVTIVTSNDYPAETISGEYATLNSGERYSIKLSNNGNTRCDAIVFLEGEHVGTWRVEAHSSIIIRRPQYTDKEFVFLAEKSRLAYQSGVKQGDINNGLVEVKFNPEVEMMRPVAVSSMRPMMASARYMEHAPMESSSYAERYSSGSTVLGERTGQQFSSTDPITNVDYSRRRTITFRIVARNERHQQYQTISHSKQPPRIEDTRDWTNWVRYTE